MIENVQQMRGLLQELGASAWTLGAIGLLFESGVIRALGEPRSLDELTAAVADKAPGLTRSRLERCLEVAATAGVVANESGRWRLAEGVRPFAEGPLGASAAGEVRSQLMQAVALLDLSRGGARAGDGWRHTDPALLQAQGDHSSMVPMILKTMIVPVAADLGARLEAPGARFLDVGAGVAALSIAMCRAYPKLDVVGLEPFEAPLAIARENVARAQLGARIELRPVRLEALAEEERYDLAWLPSFFIARDVAPAALARVRAALKPGGWLVFGLMAAGPDARARAVSGLIEAMWGGSTLPPPEAEAMVRAAGFGVLRALPNAILAQR
jgi:precorrin-6B methylase 2